MIRKDDFLSGICVLGDISTGSQTVAVDLSFPCFQGSTAPCIIIMAWLC